jgi:DNA repair exonuclease SbcCD ATPase subunit
MTGKESATTPQAEHVEDVNRIRDILFGSQMRDYDERFDSVQRDLKRLQKELDSLSERLANQDDEQNKKLQSLRRDMRKADGELRQTSRKLTDEKVDREVLGQMFIELGMRLKTGGSLADLLQGLEETGQD